MQGNVDIVRSVLGRGEKVDARTNVSDTIYLNSRMIDYCYYLLQQEGYTSLHLAVRSVKPDVVEVLLGHGADVHLKEATLGETALHLSARVKNGHLCADQLIKSGAPINEANEVSNR